MKYFCDKKDLKSINVKDPFERFHLKYPVSFKGRRCKLELQFL